MNKSLRPMLVTAALVGIVGAVTASQSQGHLTVPHGKPDSFPKHAYGNGGTEALIYRSPDGKRIAGVYHESGHIADFTFPYDQFTYVTAGSATVTVHGGETIHLAKGDVAYWTKGLTIDMDISEDFQDVDVLMSDTKLENW